MNAENYYKRAANASDYLYVLRRTIPPWCWEKALAEAVDCCKKYRIDELCVFIDSGTFTHAYPSEEWLQNYQKILFTIKRELEANGIVYSLNPNVTQGHGDRGRRTDLKHPDWTMCTDADGHSAQDCACSISRPWREYIQMQWTLYAETHPSVIWIEDDIRTWGHGPVRLGCFCREHMRRFNEMYHLNLDAGTLSNMIHSPGKPSEIRKLWLDFLGKMSAEAMELMSRTVHAVSPETIVGLMSSGPDWHMMEGRDWPELYRIMSDSPVHAYAASRPPLGNYQESSLEGLHYTFNSTLLTRKAFGPNENILEEGEIENFPYTNYSKSNVFMFLQNSLALGAGCHALTLNLFDHSGTPMMENKAILECLRDRKPFLSGLKERCAGAFQEKGIGLFFNEKSLKQKVFGFTRCGDIWGGDTSIPVNFLQNLGFGVCYDENSPVMVLAGQTVRGAEDSQILKMLSKGVFLDSAAFLSLTEMGYGEYLGGKLKKHFPLSTTYAIGGEHFFSEFTGGHKDLYFDTAIHTAKPEFCHIEPDPEAVILSEMVDVDLKALFSCCYLYQNRLGGRIAVYPVEMAGLDMGFCTPARKRVLHAIFRWLNGGKGLPVFVEGDRRMLPFRRDEKNYSIIGAYLFSLDSLENIRLSAHFEQKVQAVEFLDESGSWKPFDFWSWDQKEQLLTLEFGKWEFSIPRYFTVYFENKEMNP